MKKITAVMLAVLLLLTGCTVSNQKTDTSVTGSLVFYLKDAEMWMMDTDSGNSRQITQHMNETNGIVFALMLSENGERIVYRDHPQETEATASFSLYTLRVDSFDAEPQMIAENIGVMPYDLAADGSTVLYTRENSNTGKVDLYRYDMQESTLIVQEICDFGFTSKDNLAFYAVNKTDPQYTLTEDQAVSMTKTAFEEQHGKVHESPYRYDGSFYTMSGGVSADGVYIDVDYTESKYGNARTFRDRAVYFKGTANVHDDRPHVLKLYVKGDEQPTLIHDDLYMPSETFGGVVFASGGEVVYLDEFDKENKQGTMMLYKDGEAVLLEQNVSELVDLTYMKSTLGDLIRINTRFQ